MATHVKTYDQIGIAEDVSDIISNISPTKVPFQQAIGKEKVNNTIFEWQEDSLRAVATNAQVEGADATDATFVPTVMRNNRTQILSETVKVSRTASRVKTYGRAKEMAYQLEKAAKQVKRDLEHSFVGDDEAATAGDASTARKMAGAQQLMLEADYIYTGDGVALTEAKLLTALQQCFTNGSDPSRVMVTPSNSTVVADFAKASGRYRTLDTGKSDRTIVNVVDIYVSPFGTQKVQINRFLKTGDTLVFEPDMWAKCELDPWTRVPLAKSGDYDRQMIIGEFSLKHKNFKASALIREGADPSP
jgi:hypothetical protein